MRVTLFKNRPQPNAHCFVAIDIQVRLEMEMKSIHLVQIYGNNIFVHDGKFDANIFAWTYDNVFKIQELRIVIELRKRGCKCNKKWMLFSGLSDLFMVEIDLKSGCI